MSGKTPGPPPHVLATMTDEVSGITLVFHRSGQYELSFGERGEGLVFSLQEWLGVVSLVDKWREDA